MGSIPDSSAVREESGTETSAVQAFHAVSSDDHSRVYLVIRLLAVLASSRLCRESGTERATTTS